MNSIRDVHHLLVDLDGTLLGNHPVRLSLDFARKAMGALHKRGGWRGWRKTARALFAVQKEFGRASSDLTNDHRVIGAFARQIGTTTEEARRVLRENLLAIFPTLEKHFFPMEGAREFLDWAKSRYALTLATNPVWPREIVELRVRWAGLNPEIFSFITDVRKMRACKPAPEYFAQILSDQNLKAGECLLVGNEVKMDLPATQVGIPVFIVDSSSELKNLRFEKATAPAWRGSFGALRAMLEKPR